MNKNRLLTDEAKLEAKLLNEAWLSFKKQNPNFTQEELAHRCGWKTQGAVSQYLHGRIPLNATALSRISKVLGVKPEEIIYIGDSLKLDIEPAFKLGMKPYLIDRNNDYPFSSYTISSLTQLKEII